VGNEYISVEECKKLKQNIESYQKTIKTIEKGGNRLGKIYICPRAHLPIHFLSHPLLTTLSVNSIT